MTQTDAREAAQFFLLVLGVTGVPHWLLVATRRPYSLKSAGPAALYALGLLGPSAAAFGLERRRGGRAGQRRLAAAASPHTVGARQLGAALVAQPLMMLVAARLGRERVTLRPIDPVRTAGQLWVVTGEEFGWRGFLLPRLRRLMPPLAETAVITMAWGGWHLPMFFVPGSLQAEDQPVSFAAAIFAWSAIHHLLQIGRPSVATAMVFHAAANVSESVLDIGEGKRWLTTVYVTAGALATLAAHAYERR